MNTKVKTARLSIISNTLLIIMKVVVGIISGSVSIISEAIHSSMDLIAAFIAYFSVSVSDNPPDSKHPYGHGKVENISGVIEAILILAAAALIITEAVKKLLGEEIVLEKLWIGSIVMGISAVVNIIVSRRLYKVARETKSVALEADAQPAEAGCERGSTDCPGQQGEQERHAQRAQRACPPGQHSPGVGRDARRSAPSGGPTRGAHGERPGAHAGPVPGW